MTQTTFFQESALIRTQEPVSSRYFLLRLKAPQIAAAAQPGQFVMLSCTPAESTLTDPLLPRPLAILDARSDTGEIELLYFVAGRGTGILNRSVKESTHGVPTQLRILGPLGVGFQIIPDIDVHVGVGGGSGVAPLVFFFRRMQPNPTREAHLILAARSLDQLARADVVSARNTSLHEATDDGSAGYKGNAVEAMIDLLEGSLKNRKVGIYAAGPEPMMLATAKWAQEHGLPCRVSLEERMACGVGVCRGCVVDGLTPHPKTGLMRRTVCMDGPVFDPQGLAGAWSGNP